MRPLEIKKVRKKLNLTQTEFGKLFGLGLRTVQMWESGERIMTESVKIILKNYLKEKHGLETNSNIDIEELEYLGNLASDVIKNHHKLLQIEVYGLWFEVESQKKAIQILKE
tara:strand:- start:206 stop:541 length:336 start_codon:yes stop_codon:yes gene_type:complete